MGMAHMLWISDNVPADCVGQCHEWADKMSAEFIDLRVVCGTYREPGGAKHTHWWCEDQDGNVIDPTASQFEPGGTYLADIVNGLEVTGSCGLCGRLVTDGDEDCPLGCDYPSPFDDIEAVKKATPQPHCPTCQCNLEVED